MMLRWIALALCALPGLTRAQAQEVPKDTTVRVAPDTTRRQLPQRQGPRARQPGDTTPAGADSTRAPKELVKWEQPDSIMAALLERKGYTTTRYQGSDATFRAQDRVLTLSGKAAVAREQAVLVGDTIFYNDSTKLVRAASPPGDTIVLRDPTQGTADLVALGSMTYDIANRRGVVNRLSTSSSEAGQTWYLAAHEAAVRGDTTVRRQNTSYAENGSITSCDLAEPHYHFQAKEIKLISKRLLVARPAVLYVADIPVMWLPFIFQDMRSGRRSGVLPPRFGLSDIVRTSRGYTRTIENVGYYFALSDYMDATFSLDWRSSNSDRENDIGWTRYNGEWRYRWLDRFLGGAIRASYSKLSNGEKSLNVNWDHQQQFSQRSNLTANVNYSSNTSVLPLQAFTVAQTFAAIASRLNFQQELGPASFSIGGTRTQHSGREEVEQAFPTLNVTSKPINLASWLVWSPQLSLDNQQTLNIDAGLSNPFRYISRPGGGLDSVKIKADSRNTTIGLQTPLRIFDFNWNNSFQISDRENDFPQPFVIKDFNTGADIGTRVYERTFLTSVDWQTSVDLPRIFQGRWNIVPSISIVNSDPSSSFWVRTQLSGGRYVHQSKKLQYGLSASPTFFGLFPGFGPFTRLRHSITPTISYAYAPAGNVSDEFLRALNQTRAGYLGGIQQSAVTLQLRQEIEAKLKSRNDTNPEAAEKIKLLSLSFSPITYDFELARKTGRTGISSSTFSYNLRSDLLPGFDFSASYSLFQGNVLSDSARFDPFRTSLTASFTVGRKNNPFAQLARIFGGAGGAVTPDSVTAGAAAAGEGQGIYQQPNIAGPTGTHLPLGINTSAGWNATFSFTSTRSRPPTGRFTIVDPTSFCQRFIANQFTYDECIRQQQQIRADTLQQTMAGAPVIFTPARSTLRANVSFNLTPKWAMQWTTGYDFEAHEFSDHIVSLQRDLHDWRALFAFTQAPNGNFAFNFYISLIAEPDLKFDYNRRTYRPQTQ